MCVCVYNTTIHLLFYSFVIVGQATKSKDRLVMNNVSAYNTKLT